MEASSLLMWRRTGLRVPLGSDAAVDVYSLYQSPRASRLLPPVLHPPDIVRVVVAKWSLSGTIGCAQSSRVTVV
jgi:hypothetical protein